MHEKIALRESDSQIKPSISSALDLSTKMNPHSCLRILDFDSTSILPPLQGLPWNQPPTPQHSTPYMSLEETQMEKHSTSRLHFTTAEMAEYGEARNKKRKGKELEKRSTCERKRRSRIAERMKSLQELLPDSSYKMSAASVLDKAIEYIKSLQLRKAVLGYQQMMMDGLLMPTHNFPVRESAWDDSSDSILMANCGSVIPGVNCDRAINPSTHPGLSAYNSDGLFSSVTRSMLDSEFLLQPLQSPPMPMPIPGPLFDGFGGILASSSPSSQLVSLPVELVSFPLDSLL